MARLNILPDPRLEPLQAGLQARLAHLAGLISADNFCDLITPLAENLLLDAFERAGAQEGTIWLLDAAHECLVPAYNSRPMAPEFRAHRQPLRQGLISMVFANEQPFVMNREAPGHDRTLDEKLKVRTVALVAAPLYFLSSCRGVVSCVQLQRAGEAEPRGFEAEALRPLQRAADALRVIIDAECLEKTVGISL